MAYCNSVAISCYTATVEQELTSILNSRKLRVTKVRQAVFRALSDANKPLSIHDITTLCPQIDRVSVYRALDLFHGLHIADIVNVGWKKHYELAGPFKPHHHHLHCKNCGKTVEINSSKLEDFIDELSREYSFHGTSHKFEMTGLCALCRE